MGAEVKNHIKEQDFYKKAKETLEKHFKNYGFCVDFEMTGLKRSIDKKFFLKNNFLLRYRGRTPIPDIMGLIWRKHAKNKKLIIAEFKEKPKFRDIFQAKGYDELFDSDVTYLLSAESISESSKSAMAFINNNPALLKTKQGKSEIYVKFIHETKDGNLHLAMLGSETNLPDENEKVLRLLQDC